MIVTRNLMEHLFYNKKPVKMIGCPVHKRGWSPHNWGGIQYLQVDERRKNQVQRERQKRWDVDNLRTVGTKMTVHEYERFREKCMRERVSMYGLLRRMIAQWVEKEG